MNNQVVRDNALVLANAVEITALVCKEISGNDVSNRLNNSPLTLETLRNMSLAIIRNELDKGANYAK